MVDFVEYCDRPVRKKDGGMLNSNNIPWTHHNESDESDDEGGRGTIGRVLAHTGG